MAFYCYSNIPSEEVTLKVIYEPDGGSEPQDMFGICEL